MDYECQLLPIDKAIVGPQGFVEPLCNSCLSTDCTNPIEEKTVVFAGQPKKCRVYVLGNMIRQVCNCKGYVGDVILPLDDLTKNV